jgi:hypothetical protein
MPERTRLYLTSLRWCSCLVRDRDVVRSYELVGSKWRPNADLSPSRQAHINTDVSVPVTVFNEMLEPYMHGRTRGWRRLHSVFHDGQWFTVYCFSDQADAEQFLKKFGGERFNPAQHGRGSN